MMNLLDTFAAISPTQDYKVIYIGQLLLICRLLRIHNFSIEE
jgi:hypothetical protein